MNIYTRMIDLLQRNLSQVGVDQSQAIQASITAVEELRDQIGGDNIYLPKNTTLREKRARDHVIRSEFNGRNIPELCRKYRVSSNTVRRALRKKFHPRIE